MPYRGAQAAYQDLLGGRVDLFFDLAPTARTQIGAGTVKALATSGAQRNPMHPDVPTLREAGVDLELESWFGLFAPARTPAAGTGAAARRVVACGAIERGADDLHQRRRPAAGAERRRITRALLARDLQRWVPLVRAAGLKAD